MKSPDQLIESKLTGYARTILNSAQAPRTVKAPAFEDGSWSYYMEPLPEIPEPDLTIIKKIYHNRYKDCGRKRGALLRYIKDFKENQEPHLEDKELCDAVIRELNKIKES